MHNIIDCLVLILKGCTICSAHQIKCDLLVWFWKCWAICGHNFAISIQLPSVCQAVNIFTKKFSGLQGYFQWPSSIVLSIKADWEWLRLTYWCSSCNSCRGSSHEELIVWWTIRTQTNFIVIWLTQSKVCQNFCVCVLWSLFVPFFGPVAILCLF